MTNNIFLFSQENAKILTELPANKTKVMTDEKEFSIAKGKRFWLIPVNFLPQINQKNAHVRLLFIDHDKKKMIYYEIWQDKRHAKKVQKLFVRHLQRKYGIKFHFAIVVLKGQTWYLYYTFPLSFFLCPYTFLILLPV